MLKTKINSILIISILFFTFLIMSGCDTGSSNTNITTAKNTTSSSSFSSYSSVANCSDHENSSDYSWSASDEKEITLNYTSITTTATSGVSISSTTATITSAGTYRITGTLNDGKIVVNTSDTDTVRLILDDATITCTTNPPLDIESASKTIVVIDGTTNTLTDGSTSRTDDLNAALYCKSNLTIYGVSGTLTVNGNYNDGIGCKDGLILNNANITVNSVDDGIRGKDYLLSKSSTLTVNSTGDGLKSDNEDDSSMGWITIESGTINITTGTDGDAIQAQKDVQITGGTFTLTTGGGSSITVADENSAKAIKAEVNVIITGGTFTMNNSDDGINSNYNVFINGGTFNISCGDDGIHSDYFLEIDSGTININKSVEGIEATYMNIKGGTIYVISSDDGINVSGDLSSSSSYYLNITGGYIYVNASGDGLDANGSIYMSGGTVIVNGPTDNGNGAIDYDYTFNMTGGFLAAAGSSGMALTPSTTSTQYCVKLTYTSTVTAGTLVHIQNDSGTDILTFAPAKSYQSVVFSSPNLIKNSKYYVYKAGSCTGTATNGLYSGGTYSGGTSKGNFTVSSIITTLSNLN